VTRIPRSALVLGFAGGVFFLGAGAFGVVRGGMSTSAAPVFLLFLLIGVAALVGGTVLWRRSGR